MTSEQEKSLTVEGRWDIPYRHTAGLAASRFFRELKERLLPKHRFITDSDTEVILHLYEEKGPECVTELDGMFAFAIFNGEIHPSS